MPSYGSAGLRADGSTSNTGNTISGRSSTRVVAPPGGRSSFSFGWSGGGGGGGGGSSLRGRGRRDRRTPNPAPSRSTFQNESQSTFNSSKYTTRPPAESHGGRNRGGFGGEGGGRAHVAQRVGGGAAHGTFSQQRGSDASNRRGGRDESFSHLRDSVNAGRGRGGHHERTSGGRDNFRNGRPPIPPVPVGDSLEHFYGEKTGGKVAVSPMTRKRTPQYGTGDNSLSKATHSAAVASATRVGSPRAHGYRGQPTAGGKQVHSTAISGGTKISQPPGGGSSISIGGGGFWGNSNRHTAPASFGGQTSGLGAYGNKSDGRNYGGRNNVQSTYGRNGGRAFGSRLRESSNSYASGTSQNTGNFITNRPTTKVHAPPGGHSSFTLG